MKRRPSLVASAILLAACGAIGVKAIASGSGSPSRPPGHVALAAATAGRYKVCAENIYGIWRYTYGVGCNAVHTSGREPYTYHDLIVPANSVVDLTVARSAIARTLRVSGLGLTVRAEPRATIETSFRTHGAAVYSGECLRACSRDSKFASADVTVVTPRRYNSWLTSQATAITKQNVQRGQLHTLLIQQDVLASKNTA